MCRTPLQRSRVGIFYPKRDQDFALARFHDLGVGRILVIIPYQVQKSVHDKMSGVMFNTS